MVAPSASSVSDVSRDQFLQLFSKQLQYQDPTKPTDTDTFLQQLAQFTTVEGIEKMSQGIENMGKKLDSLVTNSSGNPDLAMLQAISAGAGLLGKNVQYGDSPGDHGVVSEVRPDAGQILVRIGDNLIPISDIASVTNAPAASGG